MQLQISSSTLRLDTAFGPVLRCEERFPLLYVGRGEERVDMYRGNFQIEDHVLERRPLQPVITPTKTGAVLEFENALTIRLTVEGACAELTFTQHDPSINRLWLRIPAREDECVWGCGEQMSYFNLRGRHFPLWTSEPGVGRDKTTYVTWRSDVENKAGGDYYNTNFPQPTFVSSAHYYLHADCSAYADFDFRNPEYHELQFWAVPASVRIESADTFLHLLEKETAFLGRQPELPDWVYNGLILGLQGGVERTEQLLRLTQSHGIRGAGVWCGRILPKEYQVRTSG